jgi:Bacteriophage head to tail connecting protein.
MGSDIKELSQRLETLKNDRRSWEADWKKLASHFLPRKCRLEMEAHSLTNDGNIRSGKLNSTGYLAMRDLQAGLHGGMTSPARPWFSLAVRNKELGKMDMVRTWLEETTEIVRDEFHRSNFYNAVTSIYGELGTFGTAFCFEEAKKEGGLIFEPLTAGEYWLDTNNENQVDTVFRQKIMTLRKLVQEFGEGSLPENLREMYKHERNWNERFTVVQAVFPREHSSQGKGTMSFVSVYWLDGYAGNDGTSGFLRDRHILNEGGYHSFPGFGIRWDVTGTDVYGGSPAMDVLPDSQLAQQMTHTMLKALHKEVDPPLQGPSGFEGVSMVPGAYTAVSSVGVAGQVISPILNVKHNIRDTYSTVQDIEAKIRSGLYNDLFRMLMSSDRRNITAKEIASKEEEKLILVGPVLERLHNEFFNPLIKRSVEILGRQGMLPQFPREFAPYLPSGDIIKALKIEYVSLLAQAQKMVSTASVEQFMGFTGNVSGVFPEVLDVINPDQMVDSYAEWIGVPPSMLRSQEERDRMREARAQRQQEQEAMQQGMASIEAAKSLGSANLDGSALGALLGPMGAAMEQSSSGIVQQ